MARPTNIVSSVLGLLVLLVSCSPCSRGQYLAGTGVLPYGGAASSSLATASSSAATTGGTLGGIGGLGGMGGIYGSPLYRPAAVQTQQYGYGYSSAAARNSGTSSATSSTADQDESALDQAVKNAMEPVNSVMSSLPADAFTANNAYQQQQLPVSSARRAINVPSFDYSGWQIPLEARSQQPASTYYDYSQGNYNDYLRSYNDYLRSMYQPQQSLGQQQVSQQALQQAQQQGQQQEAGQQQSQQTTPGQHHEGRELPKNCDNCLNCPCTTYSGGWLYTGFPFVGRYYYPTKTTGSSQWRSYPQYQQYQYPSQYSLYPSQYYQQYPAHYQASYPSQYSQRQWYSPSSSKSGQSSTAARTYWLPWLRPQSQASSYSSAYSGSASPLYNNRYSYYSGRY